MEPSNEMITRAEYARRRGVTKQYIGQAVKRGRIRLVDGMIDPLEADRILDTLKDPTRSHSAAAGRKGGRPRKKSPADKTKPRTPTPPPDPPPVPRPPTEDRLTSKPIDMGEARLELEHVKALRLWQEYDKESGQLVDLESVRQDQAAVMTMISSELDGLGGRLANNLASVTNAATIQSLIFKETRRIRATAAAKLKEMMGL